MVIQRLTHSANVQSPKNSEGTPSACQLNCCDPPNPSGAKKLGIAIEYKIQPTNMLSIRRTVKKLLENIDRIAVKLAIIAPKTPNFPSAFAHLLSPILYLISLYLNATKPCFSNQSRS